MILLGIIKKLKKIKRNKKFERQIHLAIKKSKKDALLNEDFDFQLKLAIKKSLEENVSNSKKFLGNKRNNINDKDKEKIKEKSFRREENEKLKLVKSEIDLYEEENEKKLKKEENKEESHNHIINYYHSEINKEENDDKDDIEEEENQLKLALNLSKEEYDILSNISKEKNSLNKSFKNEEFDENYGICPITQEYMECPVLTPSGIYYEKYAILDWIEKHKTDPITREKLTEDMLQEDLEYKEKIKKYREKFKKI